MDLTTAAVSVGAGLLIATVTVPAGVSGAVFLLPVQLSVLGVANPAVTPTNLLYNVVAGPGALLRHRGALTGPLTRLLLAGTVPGVVAGAVLRVYAVPGPDAFRLVAAAVLLPLGVRLCLRPATRAADPPGRRTVTALAVAAGVAGGVYGIGGGSLLGPVLAGRGMPVSVVAPAALATTFVTSIVGAATFVVLALAGHGDTAPDWAVGLLCGAGGLAGGFLGAHLRPRLPERVLRVLLGVLAIAVAVFYVAGALR